MGDHSTSSPSTPISSYPPPVPTVQPFQEPFVSNSRSTASPPPAGQWNGQTTTQPQPQGPRLRATSRATSRPVVISDAVTTAFDNSSTANDLDPEFMKRLTEQVTEQVIRTLQSANIPVPTPAVPIHGPLNSRSPSQSQRSPMRSSTDSFPPRFTPPSPRQDRDIAADSSGDRALSDAGSVHSRQSAESGKSRQSTQSNKDTPRASQPDVLPRRSKTFGLARGEDSSPYPQESHSRRRGSGSDATARGIAGSREDAGYFDSPSQRSPRSATVPEDEETTTLEKIWQPLFHGDGIPTIRLGQFLRGLAMHLIEDYEPKGGLVVTPPKMLQFLNETRVAKEYYPWDTIFGGKLSFNSISCMYRKLLCQHHLVQQQYQEPPSIPGLTPLGFETFITCLIQAHPDTEFERLAKALREMPISNADDKSERFPKELSRKLLPSQPNVQAEQRLISSLNHEPVLVQLEREALAMPPPPPAPPLQSLFVERERNPYSQSTQQSNAVNDDDLSPPAMPIERERKPYFAREGMGKKYEDDDDGESRNYDRPTTSQHRPETSGSRPSRNPRATFALSPDPVGPPPSTRSHRMSVGAQTGGGSRSKSSRRSPPPGGFARSDPFDVGAIPPSQYAPNLHSPPPGPRDRFAGDPDEDAFRAYNSRRPPDRNMSTPNADDEYNNGRPIPQRTVPPPNPSGYDSAYASGGPPSSFGHRNSADQGDQRRRSWYQGAPRGTSPMAPGGGGSDGYGSYAGNGPTYGASGH